MCIDLSQDRQPEVGDPIGHPQGVQVNEAYSTFYAKPVQSNAAIKSAISEPARPSKQSWMHHSLIRPVRRALTLSSEQSDATYQ